MATSHPTNINVKIIMNRNLKTYKLANNSFISTAGLVPGINSKKKVITNITPKAPENKAKRIASFLLNSRVLLLKIALASS